MADERKRTPDGSYCSEVCPYLFREKDKPPRCKWSERDLQLINVGSRFEDLANHPDGIAPMRCADCRKADSKKSRLWVDQVEVRCYGKANAAGNDYCGTIGERCPYVQTNRLGNMYVCAKYDTILNRDGGNFIRSNACLRSKETEQDREEARRDALLEELQDLRDRGVEVPVSAVAKAAGFDPQQFSAEFSAAALAAEGYRGALARLAQATDSLDMPDPELPLSKPPPRSKSAPRKPAAPKAPPSTVATVRIDLDDEEES